MKNIHKRLFALEEIKQKQDLKNAALLKFLNEMQDRGFQKLSIQKGISPDEVSLEMLATESDDPKIKQLAALHLELRVRLQKRKNSV